MRRRIARPRKHFVENPRGALVYFAELCRPRRVLASHFRIFCTPNLLIAYDRRSILFAVHNFSVSASSSFFSTRSRFFRDSIIWSCFLDMFKN